jgi:serine/threonine-protein kinase
MGHPSPRPALPAVAPPEPASSSGLRLRELARPAPFFLGRYLVVDEIGCGGMASVHLGRLDGPGGFHKWVALKRIHPHLVEQDVFVDMFLDEARTAASINHPNVAQVFDVGTDGDTCWLAMEYLHGESLRELMRRAAERGAPVAPALAARICADAAEGLHAAHELRLPDGAPLGLVHRDVSPHNLFITADGRTKVVDFGIAKGIQRLAPETVAGTLKGKLAYLSPEQIGLGVVDRRTDVFALGVVLWEMTTGRRLFRGDTDLDTLSLMMECAVPRPSALVPGYPPELEAFVLTALARDPWQRFQTARDLARALERYLVHSGALVGVDEVAQLVRGLCGAALAQCDARLAWAAEVAAPGACPPRPAPRAAFAPPLLDDEDEACTVVLFDRDLAVASHAAPRREQPADLGATVALPAQAGPSPSPWYAAQWPPLAAAPAPPASLILGEPSPRGGGLTPYRSAPAPITFGPPPLTLARPRRGRALAIIAVIALVVVAVLGYLSPYLAAAHRAW